MDFMDEELLQGFFTDVEESFYPQVTEAITLVGDGRLSDGVDMMMRPLHTIKGTSAFLGLSEISEFTHFVEDHLKDVQKTGSTDDPDFLIRSVDTVFAMLERARKGESLEGAGHREILEQIQGAGRKTASGDNGSGGISVDTVDGVTVISIREKRVHLPRQYQPVLDTLSSLEKGTPVLIDISGVRTLNSTTWGAIRTAADHCRIAVAGMGPACRSVFFSWEFDRYIDNYPTAEDFWRKQTS